MADEVDLRAFEVSPLVVVTEQCGALDHFVDELIKVVFDAVQGHSPVVAEGINRNRLVLFCFEVVSQLLDEFFVSDVEDLPGHQTRRLPGFVSKVVRMKNDPVVVFFKHFPHRFRRQGILVVQIGCRDTRYNDDGIDKGHRSPPQKFTTLSSGGLGVKAFQHLPAHLV